ncbi:hypothetical protein LXL04_026983 [Taraxacum kok-saghyz]
MALFAFQNFASFQNLPNFAFQKIGKILPKPPDFRNPNFRIKILKREARLAFETLPLKPSSPFPIFAFDSSRRSIESEIGFETNKYSMEGDRVRGRSGRDCAISPPGRQGAALDCDLHEIEVKNGVEHESRKRKTTMSPPTEEDDDDFVDPPQRNDYVQKESRKRRTTVCPPTQEDDDDDDFVDPPLQQLRTRFPTKRLTDFVSGLNNTKKACVNSIGFGSVLKLKIDTFSKSLAFWVVDNYNPDTNSICFYNKSITVTNERVNEIYGIPMGEEEMKLPKKSRSFENSYIPENPRTPKPLTFSKNRLRGAKNRSNISPVAKKKFRKNDFFFSKNFAYVQTFFLCICAQFFVLFQNRSKTRNFFKFFYRSLYNTYLKRFVKKNLKKNAKKKSCTYAQKIKKSCTYAKVKKKYRFFGNFFQRIVMIKNVLEGSEVDLFLRSQI